MTAKFISIEGIEGAGKSTQIAFIQEYLLAHNIKLLVTREPGGTPLAEEIRQMLLTPRDEEMAVDTELLLMFAARAQHIANKIKPSLDQGQWVLSDRFIDSTFAYQGSGRGIQLSRIETIADWTLNGMLPDLTLVFDLPVELGQNRVLERGQGKDRIEQEKKAFFESVRQAYLQRAKHDPDRIKVIDASQTIALIQQQITTHLEALMQP